MVSFICEVCNDTLKKPALIKHYHRCPNAYYTCIDCNITFYENVEKHVSCISEAEKYEKTLYKGKGKGKKVGEEEKEGKKEDGRKSGEEEKEVKKEEVKQEVKKEEKKQEKKQEIDKKRKVEDMEVEVTAEKKEKKEKKEKVVELASEEEEEVVEEKKSKKSKKNESTLDNEDKTETKIITEEDINHKFEDVTILINSVSRPTTLTKLCKKVTKLYMRKSAWSRISKDKQDMLVSNILTCLMSMDVTIQ